MTTCVNLLPPAVGKRSLVRRRFRQWLPVWIVVVMICGLGCLWQYSQLLDAQQTHEQLVSKENPSRQRMLAVGRIRQRLGELQQRESLLNTLHSTGRPLQLLGIIGQGAQLADGALRIEDFQLKAAKSGPSPRANAESQSPMSSVEQMVLQLEGTALSDLTVSSFVAALEESAVFDSVVLESSAASSAEQSGRQFKLICRYR